MDKIVYHGSSNGDIDSLKPHISTHLKECIYATDQKVVALLFMGKGNGDLDKRLSYNNGKIELIERREGVLDKIYNKAGYLYELDGRTFNHYDYLWGAEVISFEKEIKPLKKTYYPNILEAIEEEERLGNITIYRYPNRPDSMPLDNSDLIEKYISFEEKGIPDAISHLLKIYPEFTDEVERILKSKKEGKTL